MEGIVTEEEAWISQHRGVHGRLKTPKSWIYMRQVNGQRIFRQDVMTASLCKELAIVVIIYKMVCFFVSPFQVFNISFTTIYNLKIILKYLIEPSHSITHKQPDYNTWSCRIMLFTCLNQRHKFQLSLSEAKFFHDIWKILKS